MENGLLCAHFGHCQQFAIVEVNNGKITNTQMLTPPSMCQDYTQNGLPNTVLLM